MLYKNYFENIFEDPQDLQFENYNTKIKKFLGELYDAESENPAFKSPYLQLPTRRDDLAEIGAAAHRITKKFNDVVVLGTGGSSLGAQMLVALKGRQIYVPNDQARLHFPDNLAPHTMDQLLNELDLTKTHFLVISKSGGTAETIAQMLACFSRVLTLVEKKRIKQHFTIITQPEKSFLINFAEKWSIPTLEHDPNLGGRFSVLSVVGLLPAMIVGLDVVALREGAEQVLKNVMNAEHIREMAPAMGAVAAYELHKKNININVMMPYECRLKSFSAWYKQLWAESLGKDGKGTTPCDALGPVDQHSQLQLFLDGPNDKYFTIITTLTKGRGPTIDSMLIEDNDYNYMAGSTIGDLVDAESKSTIEALKQKNKAVRTLKLLELNERSLGGLIMHFMLETIIAAHLFDVNPHDQPSVELGKKLTKKYMIELKRSKNLVQLSDKKAS